MNFQLRHNLVWQIIGPIPLMVIAAIVAVWFIVPRMIANNATDQAVLAGRSTATQFKTFREYYTENVVDKVVAAGTFKASSEHKGDAKAIPLPQLVLRNLIVNAVEAMSSVTDQERMLHISSASTPSGVRIAVADSGTGIAQESIDRIFHTLFTTKSHGMGMGLSICRSIVEAHGGRLSASPSHPYGSIFEITLPAAKEGDR